MTASTPNPSPTQIKDTNPTTPSARKRAREICLQALYQWQLAGHSATDLAQQFRAERNLQKVDIVYFDALLNAVIEQSAELDILFEPFLDCKLDQLDPVSLTILRISSYELQSRLDIPYRVVINEAINLSKKFGPTDSRKFVNAVADKLAPQLRAMEISAKQS